MILTAREPVALRNEAIGYGISQIDAGSDIGVGAYAPEDGVASGKKSQFVLSDNRSLDQVIGELCDSGFLPSFCTGLLSARPHRRTLYGVCRTRFC